MKFIYIAILLFSVGCSLNGGEIRMENKNLPQSVINAKETVLNFQQHNPEKLANAISIVDNYEKPEYYERIGLNEDGSRYFYQNYYYKKSGIVIHKYDDKIKSVEKK